MITPARDSRVRRSVHTLFLGAAGLFLVNVVLGILNVFTPGDLPRGQMLAHFHAGTIGWITLSVLASTFWVFAGQRDVSGRHATVIKVLTWAGIVAVGGYVVGFYLAFNGSGPLWLLPLFGIPAALVILSGFGYAAKEIRAQATVTSAHLMFLGALLVASLGAVMGVLRGLNLSVGLDPYPVREGVNAVGAHAGPMDMYLALAFFGLLELMLRRDDDARWRWPAMLQMGLAVGAAFAASTSLFFGIPPLAPLGLVGFVLAFLVFFGRIGWRGLALNPLKDLNVGIVAASLSFPVYVGLFVFLVAKYHIPGDPLPHALAVTFGHVTFIGLATNVLLSTIAHITREVDPWLKLERAGLWLLNLGLLAFIGSEFMGDRRDGALIMAVGALIALHVTTSRLVRARQHDAPAVA